MQVLSCAVITRQDRSHVSTELFVLNLSEVCTLPGSFRRETTYQVSQRYHLQHAREALIEYENG